MPDDKQPGLFPSLKLLAAAALAGLAAGAAAVYISGGFEGNTPAQVGPQASIAAPDGTADPKCAAKQAGAAEIMNGAKGQIAAMAAADPARSLTALGFNSPDGKPMSVAGLRDKIVLMNLWATWCAPCRAEMPELDELQREKGGPDFEVVAVNVDTGDDAKPKKFLEETGIKSLGYYRENTLNLFKTLQQQGLALGLPVTLLIDREGCLLGSMNGPAAWASDDAKALIGAAIAAK